jgi:hypothetical protein
MNEKNEKRLKKIIDLDMNKENKYTVFKIFLDLIMENETEEKEHIYISPQTAPKKYPWEPPFDVTD